MRRLRPRFTLKTLLAAMVVLSLGLTVLSLATVRARQQARAVKQLESAGATIYYDFHRYYEPNIGSCINPARDPTDWTWACKLLGHDLFSNVYEVQIYDLQQWYTSPGNSVDSFGPAPIATKASQNADQFIPDIACLTELSFLDLSHSQVTDAAIPVLAKMQSLKTLDLSDTTISKSGFEELKRRLPNCKIYWHPRRIFPTATATSATATNQSAGPVPALRPRVLQPAAP